MNKFLVFAVPVMAIGLLFSCTSDIESAEEILGKGGSSSSLVPSSSSSLPSGTVLCVFSGICSPISAEVCDLIGGTFVQSCPESSSSAPSSSSSVIPSSIGDCAGFVNGTEREHYGKNKKQFCDERDGKKYVYVIIGNQTWMAENLNYNAEGSVCYENDFVNCDKYGKLYDWAMAMGFASSCNDSECSSQIEAKHKGICPSGWHLPTNEEWETIIAYIGGNNTAGKKLKATSGWNDYYEISGNGTDEFGFSALPIAGESGYWWSASERSRSYAHCFYTDSGIDRAYLLGIGNYKHSLSSVRCLQDYSSSAVQGVSSSSSSQSGSVPSSSSYGSVTYEGQTYKTVVIGTQTWMAENLNYAPSSGTFISCGTYECSTYGRLYDWSTAMALPSSCNSSTCSGQVQTRHRGVCPSGWHIPSHSEWTTLTDYVGGSSTAGRKLKATSGWYNNGNGTDEYGFSALPGGYGYSSGDFGNVGYSGDWWSAPEYAATGAYSRHMVYDSDYVGGSYDKSGLYSVRCLQD